MKHKIAFISVHASPVLPPSGKPGNRLCGHVARLAKALADSGHAVDIYTRRDSLERDEMVFFYPQIRVINVLAGPAKPIPGDELFMYMDEFAEMMLDIINEHRVHYSFMHAHGWLAGYVAIRIKQALGVPFTVSFHGLGISHTQTLGSSPQLQDTRIDVENDIIWHADQVVAAGPDELEKLLMHYHADPLKTTVAPEENLIEDKTTTCYDKFLQPNQAHIAAS